MKVKLAVQSTTERDKMTIQLLYATSQTDTKRGIQVTELKITEPRMRSAGSNELIVHESSQPSQNYCCFEGKKPSHFLSGH
ncbi:hypothetical protein Anapl_01995 [Anas platyrhynchos]|uniref:Uncharacterized protein n=1 Tax=Anas platyrhynchos TaxID=8839 RepID=R0M4C6_ANAPL|nr:hypothetical protein Anapl_01995 [Anas platyrhynchos]